MLYKKQICQKCCLLEKKVAHAKPSLKVTKNNSKLKKMRQMGGGGQNWVYRELFGCDGGGGTKFASERKELPWLAECTNSVAH